MAGGGVRKRNSRKRTAVQNGNEIANCWTVMRDLLQIDSCKLAAFFSGKMRGNDHGILITFLLLFLEIEYVFQYIYTHTHTHTH